MRACDPSDSTNPPEGHQGVNAVLSTINQTSVYFSITITLATGSGAAAGT